MRNKLSSTIPSILQLEEYTMVFGALRFQVVKKGPDTFLWSRVDNLNHNDKERTQCSCARKAAPNLTVKGIPAGYLRMGANLVLTLRHLSMAVATFT